MEWAVAASLLEQEAQCRREHNQLAAALAASLRLREGEVEARGQPSDAAEAVVPAPAGAGLEKQWSNCDPGALGGKTCSKSDCDEPEGSHLEKAGNYARAPTVQHHSDCDRTTTTIAV